MVRGPVASGEKFTNNLGTLDREATDEEEVRGSCFAYRILSEVRFLHKATYSLNALLRC